ncbi:MAG: thermonuclease family protein [Dehalococcoidia bacterium]
MRRKFIVLPLFGALLLSAALGTGARCIMVTATQVTDGNSFDATAGYLSGLCNDPSAEPGGQYHVQLQDVQAPTGDQCYAQEATDYLRSLIEGKTVCLLPDGGRKNSSTDLTAYVGVSSDPSAAGCDVFVNAEMIRRGYAQTAADGGHSPLHWLLNFLQCGAYEQQLGMWGACPDLSPPAGCRAQPTPAPEPTGTPSPEFTPTPGPTGTPSPESSWRTPEAGPGRHWR